MALERVREAVFEPSDKKIKKQVRQNQREIDREIRNLNREIKKNEKEQAKLKANIRKEAQAGNNDTVRQIAKQIVKTKGHASKLNTMIGSLTDVKMQMQSMATMAAQQRAMKNVTKMMKQINRKVSPQKFAKVMQRYAREAAKAELNEELMSDILDEGNEEAEDELVDGVLAEVGLQRLEGLGFVPVEAPETAEAVAAPQREAVAAGAGGGEEAEEEINSLEDRLRNLNQGN